MTESVPKPSRAVKEAGVPAVTAAIASMTSWVILSPLPPASKRIRG